MVRIEKDTIRMLVDTTYVIRAAAGEILCTLSTSARLHSTRIPRSDRQSRRMSGMVVSIAVGGFSEVASSEDSLAPSRRVHDWHLPDVCVQR